MINICPSSTTVRGASLHAQSLYVTVVVSFQSTLIGSFENVFKSLSSFVVVNFEDGEVLRILFASVFVTRVSTLLEAIIAFAWKLPHLICALRG